MSACAPLSAPLRHPPLLADRTDHLARRRRRRRRSWGGGGASPAPAFTCALFVFLGVLGGCGDSDGGPTSTDPDPDPPPPAPTTLQVAPAQDTLAIGESVTLEASVLDQAGAPMPGVTVTWTSSDPTVVAVTAAGEATALAEGSVRITAGAGAAEGTADLLVKRLITPVGDEGGTVSTGEGDVTVEIPAGAVSSGIAVSIASEDPAGLPAGGVPGAVVRLGPAGQTFDAPVTLRLRYDPQALAPGIDRNRLRIHRLTEGAWVPLEGASDPGEATVTTQLTSFSVYGIVADPAADLQVAYLLSPASLVPGAFLEHEAEIRNLGPDSVFTAVAELRVDGDVAAPATLPEACTVAPDSEDADLVVRCTFTDLGPGDAEGFVLRTEAGAGGGLVQGQVLIVQSDGPPDPDASNNQGQGSAEILPASGTADLAVSLSPGSAAVQLAETLPIELGVSNAGPDEAQDIQVRLRWPEGRLVLAGELDPACEPATVLAGIAGVLCTLSNLPSGTAQSFGIPMRAAGSAGAVSLDAVLAGWTGVTDSNPGNHVASAVVTVSVPDSVRVDSPEALEALVGVVSLPGDLQVVGSDITSLAPLASLVSVGGDLRLMGLGVSSLAGLENLTSLGGNLVLSDLPALADISALAGLEGVLPAGLFLLDLPLLTSLAGLDGVTEVGATLGLNRLPALTDLSALAGLTRTGGGVSLLDLGIEDLSGLASLEEVEGQVSVFWNTLPQLDHVELPALRRVGAAVGVARIPTGPDVGPGPTLRLPALEEAGGVFLATGQELQRSVRSAEFPALERVTGSMLVSRAQDLETLDLTSLTEVLNPAGATSGLQFVALPALSALTLGPATLTVLNVGCVVAEPNCPAANSSLTSLDGISSGVTVLTFLSVRGNPGLTDDDAQAFADRIGTDGANVVIGGNGPP